MTLRSFVLGLFLAASLGSAGCCFWHHHRCCYGGPAPEARPVLLPAPAP